MTLGVGRADLDHDLPGGHAGRRLRAQLPRDRAAARHLDDEPGLLCHCADPNAPAISFATAACRLPAASRARTWIL